MLLPPDFTPENARAAIGGSALRTLESAAETILPRGGRLEPGAAGAGVAIAVARNIAV